jgi:hypothetical protein
MNKLILALIFTITLCTLPSSCSKERGVDRNSPEFKKFLSAFTELSVAFELSKRDSSYYLSKRDSILASLGVDSAWIANFTKKLEGDQEAWLEVWQSVAETLDARKDSLMP